MVKMLNQTNSINDILQNENIKNNGLNNIYFLNKIIENYKNDYLHENENFYNDVKLYFEMLQLIDKYNNNTFIIFVFDNSNDVLIGLYCFCNVYDYDYVTWDFVSDFHNIIYTHLINDVSRETI